MDRLNSGNPAGAYPRNPSLAEGVISSLVIAGCMLLIFGSALKAEFYMVEERTLLALQPWTVHSWYQAVVSDAEGVQRFRPLYLAYVAMGASWFGRNPLIWHFVTLAWGVISLFLFYRVARRLGAGIVAASAFIAMMAFSGRQSWIWVNLIPQETLGVLFLSVAAWAFSIAPDGRFRVRWDAVGIGALACAALVKESFILVIPAMLGFRLLLESNATGSWRRGLGNLKLSLLAGMSCFLVSIAFALVIMMSKRDGFSANASGFAWASFRPDRLWQSVSSLGVSIPLMLAVVTLAVCGFRRPELRKPLSAVLAIAIAWLVPQLVLYSKGVDARYAFPAVISVSALITLAVSMLPRRSKVIGQLVLVALILPTIANGCLLASRSANWLAAETVSMHRLVQYVAQNVPPSQAVVIAGDSGTGYGLEALHYSLPVFLQLAGSKSPIFAWPLVSEGARDAALAARPGGQTAIANPATLDKGGVGAIIVIDTLTTGLHAEPITEWLAGSQWNEVVFAESYRYVGDVRKPSVGVDVIRHTLLVPARMIPANDIVTIHASLASNVGVNPLVDGPPWGLEQDYAGPGKIAWLGQGDREGMGGTFTAEAPQSVLVSVDVVPGPSRSGYVRTVELALGAGSNQRVSRGTFDGSVWEFEAELTKGANPFRLRIVDAPTVAELPNGDKRTLMALVRRITVRDGTARPSSRGEAAK